jgi:hypothetical protein
MKTAISFTSLGVALVLCGAIAYDLGKAEVAAIASIAMGGTAFIFGLIGAFYKS